MMLLFTRLVLVLPGGSALIIGLMIFLIGPHATASLFGSASGLVLGAEAYSGGLDNVNVDSEMRFYSVFWIAYGIGLLWATANRLQHSVWVYSALGLFFLGGIGRLISFFVVGAPDPLFTALMAIELVVPTIAAIIYAMAKGANTPDQ